MITCYVEIRFIPRPAIPMIIYAPDVALSDHGDCIKVDVFTDDGQTTLDYVGRVV